ncbi:MAG: hypothetical protein PHQ96_09160, partial [Candidatus Omnitrophica bacterium]|nr:hypothetical protein [Candidatus Omnitrophota bacterium]
MQNSQFTPYKNNNSAQSILHKTNHVNAELSKSEAQYRLTLDSMGDPIHVVDSSLRFILFNKA